MQKAAEKTAATAVPATRKRARPQRKEEQKMFCLAHRQVGMVDLRNNHCAEEGCSKRPTHAFDGQKAKFCAAHREVGMMNVVTLVSEQRECCLETIKEDANVENSGVGSCCRRERIAKP